MTTKQKWIAGIVGAVVLAAAGTGLYFWNENRKAEEQRRVTEKTKTKTSTTTVVS